jgi:hypothetical protein
MKKSYAIFFYAKFGIYHNIYLFIYLFIYFVFLFQEDYFSYFKKVHRTLKEKKSQFVIFRHFLFIACCKNL